MKLFSFATKDRYTFAPMTGTQLAFPGGGTIPPPANQAPSVTINGTATGTVGTQQSFQAIASDSDGQVVKVELCLMANASTLTSYTVLDTDLVSPFVLNWTPTAAGNFNLRMRATDDKGAASFSSVLAVQVSASTTPAQDIILAGVGDSIQAGPSFGSGDDPANAPIMFAAARITSPAVAVNKFGYPGKTMRWFLDNHQADVAAVFQSGKRGLLYFAFGANDINSRYRAQRYADFIEARDWALSLPNVEKVVFIPVLNRTDSTYGFALNDDNSHGDFNTERLVHNQWLIDTLAAGNSRVITGDFSQDAALGAAAYSTNTLLCENDLVHPTIVGSRHQGERVIAPALAEAGGITLGPVTADSTGVAQTLTTAVYKPQQPQPLNATVDAGGQLIHQTNGEYDCGTPLSELIARPQINEVVIVKVVGINIPSGGAVLLTTGVAFAQNKLAKVQWSAYCDEGNIGAYDGVAGNFPNKTQARGGQGNELSLRYTSTTVTAYAGNVNLGTKTLGSNEWPQIPGAQMNGLGASMAAPTILANTHLASAY